MRALVVALGLLAFTPSAFASTHHEKKKATKHHAKKRAARTTTNARELKERIETRAPAQGQSVGAPWEGRLQHASELPASDAYVIRRPNRAFGVETTIDFIQQAVGETIAAFPDVHVLAIGDISQQDGGGITQHHSHQSGRDADIGLFYVEKPQGYPASFIDATPDNLDCAATFKLLESFLATADDDGGVQVVFLDFDVQGILYNWALDHGVSERRLERIFQFPHGRGASGGMVRHEPNHANHMHVRFKCRDEDSSCRQ